MIPTLITVYMINASYIHTSHVTLPQICLSHMALLHGIDFYIGDAWGYSDVITTHGHHGNKPCYLYETTKYSKESGSLQFPHQTWRMEGRVSMQSLTIHQVCFHDDTWISYAEMKSMLKNNMYHVQSTHVWHYKAHIYASYVWQHCVGGTWFSIQRSITWLFSASECTCYVERSLLVPKFQHLKKRSP